MKAIIATHKPEILEEDTKYILARINPETHNHSWHLIGEWEMNENRTFPKPPPS